MSGRVNTIAYINESTTGMHGTNFIWHPSSSDVGLFFHDNNGFAGSGVEADLALLRLKNSRVL